MKRLMMMAFCLVLGSFGHSAVAQKFSLSANILEYLNLGTLQMEASAAPSRRWTLHAECRYNPFRFQEETPGKSFQNKSRSFAVGTRYWPWHVYSGWWASPYVQYQEYSRGGVLSRQLREGDRWGAGLGFGYTYMVGKHWNMDFGLKVWAGADRYRHYDCLFCGTPLESGRKWFVLPDGLILAFSYVF